MFCKADIQSFLDLFSLIRIFWLWHTEDRWTSFKELSESRGQSLVGIIDDLKVFDASYDQLIAWLAQKDKMATVLGLIATEPAMVHSQLQQVEVCIWALICTFFVFPNIRESTRS